MDEAKIIDRFLNLQEINLTVGKEIVRKVNEHLTKQFFCGTDILSLSASRCLFVDHLIQRIYRQFNMNKKSNLAIVAVGGYGREELHPFTDIDLLIVSDTPIDEECASSISDFITLLWDCRLDIGHAVRTIEECIENGKKDITIATNLLDARLICGSQETFSKLQYALSSDDFWTPEEFYKAKLEEQNNRHQIYRDTMYTLEPDLKNIPGGLRDLQTIQWIAQKVLKINSFKELAEKGYLTDSEYREIELCQFFLWKVRFALQNSIKRNDNRLTFDRQVKVAKVLGYLGDGNEPVEKFMSIFYQTTRRISEINEMMLHLFREKIFKDNEEQEITFINSKFLVRGKLIDTIDPELFTKDPVEILNLFLAISEMSEQNSQIKISGIYPTSLRQIRYAKRNLTDFLQNYEEARKIFLNIISNPSSMILSINLMHKYSILSIYLPQWPNLVGQMQFDMFHTYTVDEHIYRTMKFIYDFSHQNQGKNILFKNIYDSLPKKGILYVSALFHDIAKGRHNGIHHAEGGAQEVLEFARIHNLPHSDSRLISWLVKNHLAFSTTALRRDISDPDVIQNFANVVQDEIRLGYLYCLTVADICATNDTEWNEWKQTLFNELYYSTQQAIRLGPDNLDFSQTIKDNQEEALKGLEKVGISDIKIAEVWKNFSDEYFIKNSGSQIFLHTRNILNYDHTSNIPMVLFGQSSKQIGTELFVYTKDRIGIFGRIVSILVSSGISILEASILNSKNDYIMDTFIVVDKMGHSLRPEKSIPLQKKLLMGLLNPDMPIPIPNMKSSKVNQFKVKTSVHFLNIPGSEERGLTHIEISALDRPGLLALIASVFQKCEINISAARIATTGERADDGFSISNSAGNSLTTEQKEYLKQQLLQTLTLQENE